MRDYAEVQDHLVPRARVYRFGVMWHWKCYELRCMGGPDRVHSRAISKARAHVAEHAREILGAACSAVSPNGLLVCGRYGPHSQHRSWVVRGGSDGG